MATLAMAKAMVMGYGFDTLDPDRAPGCAGAIQDD